MREWLAMVYETSDEVKCQFSPRVVMSMVDIIESLREYGQIDEKTLASYWSELTDMVADDNSIISDMQTSDMLVEFVGRIRKQFI